MTRPQITKPVTSDLIFPLAGLEPAVFIFSHITEVGISSEDDSEFIAEMVHLVNWMALLAKEEGNDDLDRIYDIKSRWVSLYRLQSRQNFEMTMKMTRDMSLQHTFICPNRLWNLAVASNDGCNSMLPILDHIQTNALAGYRHNKDHHTAPSSFAFLPTRIPHMFPSYTNAKMEVASPSSSLLSGSLSDFCMRKDPSHGYRQRGASRL